ncbi:hypothetical protein A2U01_0100060, partial [Trifolium medium]|nr:hypothetical protein [Trifolium medium]
MELMANAMAQEAVSRTTDRVAQEARRGGEDELGLEGFKGGYDPDGAQTWIEGIERIFGAMRCLDEHRVLLG